MSHQETGVFPFHGLSGSIRSLDKASRQLSEILTAQLNAVIIADADKIIRLTEKNVSAQEHFHEMERAFISELKQLIPDAPDKETPVTLESLKQSYPEYTGYIDEWQSQITVNIERLQRQQDQLVQLLDFAQKQNASMMRSIYDLQNGKNLHYGQNGEKSGVSAGMAVNQEG